MDVICGSMSKSLASTGGFVAASREVIEYLRTNSKQTIFSAAISPSQAACAQQSLELMHSFAASSRQTLFKLRFPAAVAYLIPALKLAAAGSIVGAIVAEISSGMAGGIGRLILDYFQKATGDPARVFTAFLGAAALGLIVAGFIGVLEKFLLRNRPKVDIA